MSSKRHAKCALLLCAYIKEIAMTQFEQPITASPSNVSRRSLLAAAALGASGLALNQAAAAVEGSDSGKPGDGGYGRNSVQLPPGAKLASHDPKDVEAMPEFKYSIDGD